MCCGVGEVGGKSVGVWKSVGVGVGKCVGMRGRYGEMWGGVGKGARRCVGVWGR